MKKSKNVIRTQAMAAPSTPKKCYYLGNICVVCGFSFVTKSVDKDGNVQVAKCLDKKLRLTRERLETLWNIRDFKEETCFPLDSGVCQKCFRAMERVLKVEKEAAEARERFKSSTQSTMTRLVATYIL
jgi:hypothetical protein